MKTIPLTPVAAKRPPLSREEIARVALNLTLTCALGALVLGGVYLGTERWRTAAQLAGERRAVTEMLALGPGARVLEVRQFLAPAAREVIYAIQPYGESGVPAREVVFTLEGEPRAAAAAAAGGAAEPRVPLGRLFVATSNGAPAGFVLEGESRGYKNRIRFFVALDSAFTLAGVRVVEHEEDPGLGAEVATPWFQGQFLARRADAIATLDVTRDPMPEDWRAALAGLGRESPSDWRAAHAALVAREAAKPIYAVTGATISSRALTRGVRTAVDHFRRRWALLGPRIGENP